MLKELWSSAKRWFLRLFRREPEPGRFESGSKSSIHGIVGTAPHVLPSRDYLVYVPRGRSRWKRAPMVVLCHGCRQTPEEIAEGTRIAAFADRVGCIVLLPRQKDSANPWRCWNWFDRRTAGGNGEAAIVAAQIRSVRKQYRVDRKRVMIAGMSAGGALAAIIGVRYPGLVSCVAVHSGLACGAAASHLSAINVMKKGPDQDVEAIATEARAKAAPADVHIPLLAVHGGQDDVVAPVNAVALVRQFLRLNDHPSLAAHDDANSLPPADAQFTLTLPDGRTQDVREWRRAGRLVARYVAIDGLGHAWSGGSDTLPYNDAALPDATALVGEFFTDALS